MELDETRQDKLEAMQVAARKYISENIEIFENAVKILAADVNSNNDKNEKE